WEASDHVDGFNDPMIDCRESKARYRYDHLMVFVPASDDPLGKPFFCYLPDTPSEAKQRKKAEKAFGSVKSVALRDLPKETWSRVIGPNADKPRSLTEPRAFNLMFKTYIGATATEDDVAYLRPETAQGIFVQFKNVVDSTRVKVPFGIAQTGKAFRNEVTPRNLTFRSREFEQMEIEFFCHPGAAREWYEFWRSARLAWWKSVGLAGENLRIREQSKDELAHYAKDGAGTSDIEYRFPFTDPDFGEIEGVAHRADFDLATHQKMAKQKLEYFDSEHGEELPNGGKKSERDLPHVIEPSAGLDRGVLGLLCEACTEDAARLSPELLRLDPKLAPIKAAVFPLVAKDGMPEISAKLHAEVARSVKRIGYVEHDIKGTIGKR